MAVRLHNALIQQQRRPDEDYCLDRLIARLAELHRTRRRHQVAQRRQWGMAMVHCRRDLHQALGEITYLIGDQITLWRRAVTAPIVLSPAQILEDIESLKDDLDEVEWVASAGTLVATTEPIELESISLGRFRIVLDVKRLLAGSVSLSAFRLEALDPNPPSTDESITHPHVRDGAPCLGDASGPIERALQQGRISDAFRLVDRVLHTYNASSPFHRLDQWHGVECEDCGDIIGAEESRRCLHCEQTLCASCEICCDACGGGFCRGCLDRTADGTRYFCEECRGRCDECDALDAAANLTDGLCDSCLALREEEAADEEAAAASATEPSDD